MSTVQRRVRFIFVDDVILEGDVIAERLTPTFNNDDRVVLQVDVPDRGCYRVLDDETVDV